MDYSFYLSNFRQSDIFIIYDGDGPFLIVGGIGFTAVLRGLIFGKPVFLFTGFAKTVSERGL